MALIVSACAVFFACGPAATGAVEVRVTDKPPGNVTAIVVTIDEIAIHRAGAGNESGWETIPIVVNGNVTANVTFDLWEVAGNETVLGYAPSVPAGNYTQLRMHVVSVNVTIDGNTTDATVPSEWLKIVRPFEVVSGGTTTLIIDFDADKSIVVTGAGEIKLMPVVQLLVREPE
ncbi:MAG: DUF4382 domain-containing protein [Dehalococcoidia bacterium]|nr:DUF4382 domain-containing protein [Dehalococcoidia bacterium]